MAAILASLGRLAAGVFAGRTMGAAGGAAGGAAAKGAARATPSALQVVGTKAARAAGHRPSDGTLAAEKRDAKLNRLWRLDSTWNLFERVSGLIASNVPSFTHAIQVSVIGGPEADIRRCWFLACSTVFGRYRNRVKGLAEVNVEATWDITAKAVMISVAYINSGITGNLQDSASGRSIAKNGILIAVGGLPAFLIRQAAIKIRAERGGVVAAGPPALGPVEFIQRGPDQVTIGAGWPDWFNTSTDILRFRFGVGAPKPTSGTAQVLFSEPVFEKCGDDSAVIFKFSKRNFVDVLAELPRLTATQFVYPYGRVSAIAQQGIELFAAHTFNSDGSIVANPLLPDDGRIITTGEKRAFMQPPKPWVDGKSRMTAVELISAAIRQPCYAPSAVPCMVAALNPGYGHSLYPAGQNLTEAQVQAGLTTYNTSDPLKNRPLPTVAVATLGD